METERSVRVWRSDAGLCMSGTTAGYAVDPVSESVLGVVVTGAMRVRRGRESFVFEPGDVCAWDPSAAHRGEPYGCDRWAARLLILESPPDVNLESPLVRDPGLARGFIELHRALESPSWALERETQLSDWLSAIAGGPDDLADRRRAARRDPALRRACELLHDELAGNVTLDELAAAAGVSRHRLSRLFRRAYGLPPHRFQLAHRIDAARRLLERGVAVAEVAQETGFFDQSHLHRHFRRTLGMTPARYARVTAQTYKTRATG